MDKDTYTCVVTDLMHAIIVFKTLETKGMINPGFLG